MQRPKQAVANDTRHWIGIASLLQKSHELLCSTLKPRDELLQRESYEPILEILQSLLEEWLADFENANGLSILHVRPLKSLD